MFTTYFNQAIARAEARMTAAREAMKTAAVAVRSLTGDRQAHALLDLSWAEQMHREAHDEYTGIVRVAALSKS